MSSIGPGHKAALLEAFHAAVALLPPNLRNGLVLVGGTSLLSLGGNRKTRDVDFAVTAPALHAFYAAADNDPRFRKDNMETWEYRSASGIIVPFEFLSQGGGFAPIIREAKAVGSGGGMRAGLGELAIMKARTWLGRDDDKDLEDFKFLLVKMGDAGESFRGMELAAGDGEEMGDLEALKTAGEDVGAAMRPCCWRCWTCEWRWPGFFFGAAVGIFLIDPRMPFSQQNGCASFAGWI